MADGTDAFEPAFRPPRGILTFAKSATPEFLALCADWMRQAGLEVELECVLDGTSKKKSSNIGSEVEAESVKKLMVISARREQLEVEAERIGCLKAHTAQKPLVEGRPMGKVEFVVGDNGFEGYESPEFWLPGERVRLLQGILNQIELPDDFDECIAKHNCASVRPWRQEVAQCSIRLFPALAVLGLLEAAAPLHEEAERRALWRDCHFWTALAPQKQINHYFGSKVAIYFAWMNSFTSWLVPLACLGFATYCRMRWYEHDHDDDPYLALYSLVTVLWAVAFLRRWQGRCASLAWEWGVHGVLQHEAVRPEFRGALRTSPVSGVQERHFPAWKRAYAYMLSVLVTLVMLCVAFFAMICSLNLQGYMPEEATNFERVFHFRFLAQFARPGAIFDPDQERFFGVLTFVPVILHVLTIGQLNDLYRRVAEGLTWLENHRLRQDQEDALIAKRFLFEAFDCYVAPFYVAFVQQDVRKLRSELMQVYVVDCIRRVLLETLVPLFIKWRTHRKNSTRYAESKKDDDRDGTSLAKEHHIDAMDYLQDPEYDEFDDFLEMVIEFGYITLFASAFPLAGLLSIACNIIEIKSDLFKLVWIYQRPPVLRVATLGTWGVMLKGIVCLSCLTNAMIFTMSGQLAAWMPEFYREAKERDVLRGLVATVTDEWGDVELVLRKGAGRYVVVIAVVVEHLLFFAALLLFFLIPAQPGWVSDEIARLELYKEESARRLQRRRCNSDMDMSSASWAATLTRAATSGGLDPACKLSSSPTAASPGRSASEL